MCVLRFIAGMCASITLTALMTISTVAWAEPSEIYDLDIPRQSLDDALKDFAWQTRYQVAWFTDVAKFDLMVGPVVGAHSMHQAMTLMLCEWNLTYRLVNERTLAVVPATHQSCPDASTLIEEL
jgi:iron complex outermembrane recepter protein